MSKTFDLGNGKILKFNPKAMQDTMDLFKKSVTSVEDYNEILKKLGENPDFAEAYAMGTYREGKTLWLEVKVTDSFMAGMLHAWMFGKSEFDGSRIEAMGCTLDTLYFSRPTDFTEEERKMMVHLLKKITGNEGS